MSVPHTGRLTAKIFEFECQFDGNRWTVGHVAGNPGADLLAYELNGATAVSPKTHYDIHSLALHVLTKLGLQDVAQITSWSGDSWPATDELQEGDVD